MQFGYILIIIKSNSGESASLRYWLLLEMFIFRNSGYSIVIGILRELKTIALYLFSKMAQIGPGAHPASYSMGTVFSRNVP